MTDKKGFYDIAPEKRPESVEILDAFIVRLSEVWPENANMGKLMPDDIIYLRQNNEFEKAKMIRAKVFLCPLTDKEGNVVEDRYKIHEVIR